MGLVGRVRTGLFRRAGAAPPGAGTRRVACVVPGLVAFLAAFLAAAFLLAGTATATTVDPLRGETALTACLPSSARHIPVTGPGQDGFFSGTDGTLYFPAELLWQGGKTAAAPAGTGPLAAVPAGPANRWELVPAWIVERSGNADRLLQATALEAGTAVYAPQAASGSCADMLRRSEDAARRARRGRWSEAGRILSAHDPDALQEHSGTYAIVRGRVVSLGKTDRTRYLNFGRFWKTDFTVTLRASDETTFDAALTNAGGGAAIAGLTGRRVEVRGMVDIRDGPHMALRHPEQIVVLEE